MKRVVSFISAFLVITSGCRDDAGPSTFPSRPIKIVVYTEPGGLIDTTARKFADIAAKHRDATFVVENKPGAGGLVALKKVLRAPADGYTLYACTKSNISKFVETGGDAYIDAMDWIAMLMADPECVITLAGSPLETWDAVVQDARARPGQQIWLGPAIGGLDHVTALKVWEKFGITAKWIPFKSGGMAKAALLGNQGVAYVGNPSDAEGQDRLNVAVVSSPQRLPQPQYSATPTFGEFGVEGLDQEYMWRGFAVRKGTPPEALEWFEDLFGQVTADPAWRAHWEKSGIDVVYHGPEKFTQIVQRDRQEFATYLSKIGILRSERHGLLDRMLSGAGRFWLAGVLLLLLGGVAVAVHGAGAGERLGYFLIPAFFVGVCLLFFALTLTFPQSDEVGPAAVPRLWMLVLAPLSVYLLYRAVKQGEPEVSRGARTDLVVKFGLLLVVYVAAMEYLGYFLCSLAFLLVTMHMLGYRRYGVMLAVSLGWLAVSYWLFVRLLYVTLPMGRLAQWYLA